MSTSDEMSSSSPIAGHYAKSPEQERLEEGVNRIERERIEEMIGRFLPEPPGVVRDIGGGPGYYAGRLAEDGYQVHLVDLLPMHVEQAQELSDSLTDASLADAAVADARDLPWDDASSDAALLLGPLYHLQDREDRMDVLEEANRVLEPGGTLIAVAISRFASTLEGTIHGRLEDPTFAEIAERERETGNHDNPTGDPEYFTESYFHLPDELDEEISEAGFAVDDILGIEGPAWLAQDFDERWKQRKWRERFTEIAEDLEDEPSLRGMSVHMMAVAKKPE
ncbi:MAG: class I SAM-dependent methyltransferase [Bradymonadaceae bacterium]